MFKILDKRNGEVTAEQQAVFNKISTNNADGYVDGFLNSLRIAKMSSNVISIDSGLLSIQGFRSVNDTLTTYTVSVTPSEPIPFQLVATYSHYISDENDTLEITTRPTQELRREPLFSGQNAVYEVELAEFNMTADGIADFAVTLEKIVYNEQDLSELLDKVTKAEQESATALKKVKELETQVIEKQGTAVYIGGEAQSRVNFTSDPQTQITANKNAITEAQSDIESNDNDITALQSRMTTAEDDIDDIANTYAKLSQVVRVDSQQSMTDVNKAVFYKNSKYRVQTDAQLNEDTWKTVGSIDNYGQINMTIATTIVGAAYTCAQFFLSVSYLERASITSIGNSEASFVKAIRLRSKPNAQTFIDVLIGASSSEGTIGTAFDVTMHNKYTITDFKTFNFVDVTDDGSGSVTTLRLDNRGINTTGTIWQQGSPVLVGSAPSWVTGTSGSLTLPTAGWYILRSSNSYSSIFYFDKGYDLAVKYPMPSGYVSILSGGTISRVEINGTAQSDISYYKLA